MFQVWFQTANPTSLGTRRHPRWFSWDIRFGAHWKLLLGGTQLPALAAQQTEEIRFALRALYEAPMLPTSE